VPVLVTDRGGPREVVEDGVTGRVLPPRDPALWADATSALLDDPARRRAMGERAHAVASVHDAAYAAGCLGHYRAALRRSTS